MRKEVDRRKKGKDCFLLPKHESQSAHNLEEEKEGGAAREKGVPHKEKSKNVKDKRKAPVIILFRDICA